MNHHIKQVAILGSGIMGSRIACHFAGIGVKVLLLDISPNELNDLEKKKGHKISDPIVKNRIVNDALANCLSSNPSPIYKSGYASRITTGNFEDNMQDIKDADWIIEAVIENLEIKISILRKSRSIQERKLVLSPLIPPEFR